MWLNRQAKNPTYSYSVWMPPFAERFFPNRRPKPVVPWVGHYKPLDPSLSPALSEAIRKLKASREQTLLTREQDTKG